MNGRVLRENRVAWDPEPHSLCGCSLRTEPTADEASDPIARALREWDLPTPATIEMRMDDDGMFDGATLYWHGHGDVLALLLVIARDGAASGAVIRAPALNGESCTGSLTRVTPGDLALWRANDLCRIVKSMTGEFHQADYFHAWNVPEGGG